MSDVDRKTQRRKLPDKKFVALLYLPLMIPGIIPIYYGTRADDSTVAIVMIATGIGILILNAIVLVATYRWFARPSDDNE